MVVVIKGVLYYRKKSIPIRLDDKTKEKVIFRKISNKKGTGIGACRTGVAGFEPTNDGVKVRCLTAWLYPNGLGDRGESNPRMSVPQTDALTTSPRSPSYYLKQG